PKLLEYREVFKLKSTYIEPLLNYASHNKNSRIFTSFLQSGTATGRLSSKNPNLQNIPVRSELGRKIREGFVSEEGFKLVSLDYSQIELRLLAHFSQDRVMMDAFFDDKDIHYETAKKIFGEDKAKSKRDVAKSINFGLIYGMGARKLGETLKIPQKEAKEYIDSYFASFPTIKTFLGRLEDEILQNGYSQTLLKRRRFFDFHGVAEYMKGAFLREGVNTLFQGSAADIIKLSMNRIDPLTSSKCQMLLQIHDELIFEVEDSETKHFGEELKEIMENIYKLNIPLKCELNIGENWGELK
ncbi:MAG: DNA polymerase, partial [Campylobacterales bacterium]